MEKLFNIVISISLCLLVGFISSHFQTNALVDWYPFLNKAPLTPPDILFPIVWSIIYVVMGISIALITLETNRQFLLVTLFVLQLLANFLWSIAFFYLRSPLLGVVDITILNILLILYIVKAWSVNKWGALLFIPYWAWVLFATYLNVYILTYN